MTKYLMKIISICSFIVLIPIIIVGVALSAVGSTLFNVEAFASGVKEGVAYSITIGEEKSDKVAQTSAKFMNGTSVNINFVSDGYKFLGWAFGDLATFKADQIIDGTNGNPSYTFDLSENTKLTAVVEVKNYTLSFNAVNDENQSVDLETKNFAYGEDLTDLITPVNPSNKLLGWRIVGGEDQTIYEKATFADDSIDYILEPVWSIREKVIFYTYDNGKEISSSYMTKDQLAGFKFPDATSGSFATAIGNGYEFDGWCNEIGEALTEAQVQATEFNPKDIVKIYVKRVAKSYTLNVEVRQGQPTLAVEYKQGEGYKLTNLEKARKFYTLTGLEYNGVVYNKVENDFVSQDNTKLSDVFTTGSTTVNGVKALWTCEYNFIKFNSNIGLVGNQGFNIYGLVDGVREEFKIPSITNGAIWLNSETENCIDLETSLYDYCIDSKYTSFELKNPDNGNFEAVKFRSIIVYYNGTDGNIDNDVTILGEDEVKNLSFANLMAQVQTKDKNYNFVSGGLNVAFVFDRV